MALANTLALVFLVVSGARLAGGQDSGRVPPQSIVKQIAAAPLWEHVELAKAALRQYPDYPPLLLLLGNAQLFEGEFSQAQVTLDRCLALVPDTMPKLKGACACRRVAVDYSRGEVKKASEAALELLQHGQLWFEDRFHTRLLVANSLLFTGKLREVEEHLRILEGMGESADEAARGKVLALRLQLLMVQKRYAEAVSLLPRLLQSPDRNVWAVGILAHLFLDLPEDLQPFLQEVPLKEVPGYHRHALKALLLALQNKPHEAELNVQLVRFPRYSSGYLVGAWVARRQGKAQWEHYLLEAARQQTIGIWAHPPWWEGGVSEGQTEP
ncbi:MAG: tetratricopeptide repeat protein [Thermoanaerobaculum sp.]